MKKQHFVTARRQRGQVFFQRADRSEQIRDEQQQRAFLDRSHDAVQRRGQVRGVACRRLLETEHQVAQVTGPVPCREVVADAFVKVSSPTASPCNDRKYASVAASVLAYCALV